MKNLIIVQNSIKTTYKFRKNYIEFFLNQGGSVYIVSINDDDSYKSKLVDLGCVVYCLKKSAPLIVSIFYMNVILMYLRFSLKNVVVISHFLVTFIFCFFSLRFFSKKVVIYTEGLGSLFLKDNFLRRFVKFLLSSSNITRLFCNRDERNILGKNSDIITGGIGIKVIDKLSFVKKNEDCLNILYVGRLIKDKGIDDVLKVFDDLYAKLDGAVKLTVVGDVYINNPSSLSQVFIDEYKNKYGNSVNFTGYVDNPDIYYAGADILLLLSKREGFPVCVMEASMFGVPSIVYDVPGCSDAVIDNVNGFVVKYKDVSSVSKKILELNSSNLSKLSFSSRQYAIKEFDVDLKTKQIINVINSLY